MSAPVETEFEIDVAGLILRVVALEAALADAATSLETIARDGARKGTMLEDRSQISGYATSRARCARVAVKGGC